MAKADATARVRSGRRPATSTAGPAAGVPRWLVASSLACAVSGLAVAAYLTFEHYTASTTLACADSGTVNCLKVTTSAQSRVFGIPVALLGLIYFATMVGLCLPVAWRSPRPALRTTRIAAASIGVAFVFYLLYAELFVIGNICLWCTAVHLLAIALFAILAFGAAVVENPAARTQRP